MAITEFRVQILDATKMAGVGTVTTRPAPTPRG